MATALLPLAVSATPVTGVPPSMVTETVPVGAVDPLTGVTVMVKVSEALRAGVALDAETVVVVAIREVLLAGQAAASTLRSTEPSPVTSS